MLEPLRHAQSTTALADRIRDHARQAASTAPPLTRSQVDKLATIWAARPVLAVAA